MSTRGYAIHYKTTKLVLCGPWPDHPRGPWPFDVEATAVGDAPGVTYHRYERLLPNGESVFVYVAMPERSTAAAKRLRDTGAELPWNQDQDDPPACHATGSVPADTPFGAALKKLTTARCDRPRRHPGPCSFDGIEFHTETKE